MKNSIKHLSVLAMVAIIGSAFNIAIAQRSSANAQGRNMPEVTPPPTELELDEFYQKYISANGYPIVSSAKVNDYALREAEYLVNLMLANRPDVRDAMIESGSRMIIMAYNEYTTDIPDYAHMRPKDYWNVRARGLGGSSEDPICSCGEENLLAFEGDPYGKENILIHEFAHNIHLLDRRGAATRQWQTSAGTRRLRSSRIHSRQG